MRKICLLIVGFGTSAILACLLVDSMVHVRAETKLPMEPTEGEYAHVMQVDALAPADVTLPVDIAGTTLRAEQLVYYEGNYMEDGSDQEVVDIAGLQVRNYGREMVDLAEITLRRGTMVMHFQFECIPPGGAAVALEGEKQKCIYNHFTSCTGQQSTLNRQWVGSDCVRVEFVDGNRVRLANQTNQTFENLKLYYKTCLEGRDVSIGGRAYVAEIGTLDPYGVVERSPDHLANGNTRILGVAEE